MRAASWVTNPKKADHRERALQYGVIPNGDLGSDDHVQPVKFMRIYSDSATRRLEEYAGQHGVICQVRKIEAHEEGRYFIISVDEVPLKWPIALGFTDDQAQYALKRGAWQRYAVKAEPTRLDSAPPKPASSRRSKRRYPW